jgi:hypothetical protein
MTLRRHRKPMKIMAALFLFLLPAAGQSAFAQENRALERRFVASVEKNEPQWKVGESKTFVGNGELPDVVYVEWWAGNKPLSVLVYVCDSLDAAKESYPTAFNNCPDCLIVKKHLGEKIQNLGDENRSWEDQESQLVGVVFRKGKSVATVEAPSKELAQKLAFYIVNQLN